MRRGTAPGLWSLARVQVVCKCLSRDTWGSISSGLHSCKPCQQVLDGSSFRCTKLSAKEDPVQGQEQHAVIAHGGVQLRPPAGGLHGEGNPMQGIPRFSTDTGNGELWESATFLFVARWPSLAP